MKNPTILLLSALTLLSFQNYAIAADNETVVGVIDSMRDITDKMKVLKNEANDLLTENTNAQKKSKLWAEQLETRLPPLYASYTKRANKSIEEEKRLTVEINRYNTVCSGEVPKPQYDKCMAEKPILTKIASKHKKERLDLIKEKKDLDKERDKYINLFKAENKLITKNYKRHLAIQKKNANYMKTLEYYRKRLNGLCKQANIKSDSEALHHCYSVYWDGTNKTLPSLDRILQGTQFFGK